MEVYAAMVDRMDQGIGRHRRRAAKQGKQLDNTLILFLQDNGGCAERMGRGPRATRLGAGQADAAAAQAGTILPADDSAQADPRRLSRCSGSQQGDARPAPTRTSPTAASWANVSNTPFREYKHWVHEGGISTPLIAHWPARIKAQGRASHSSPAT